MDPLWSALGVITYLQILKLEFNLVRCGKVTNLLNVTNNLMQVPLR